MAKSKLQESHVLSVEGTINTEDMTIEIEELGEKSLVELLSKFNGQNVKLRIGLNTEIFE